MSRARAVLAAAVLAACTSPPPPPSLPGSFVGAFQFTATLLEPDGSVPGLPATTCPVELDGGFASGEQTTVTFYAYLSERADAGGVFWQILGGPYEDGGLDGGAFGVDVTSCAPITGCNCVASVNEQVELAQTTPDGGPVSQLNVPVLRLSGWIEDTLSTDAPVCIDAGIGPQACFPDAGPGCGLGPDGICDVVYTVVGIPGLPN